MPKYFYDQTENRRPKDKGDPDKNFPENMKSQYFGKTKFLGSRKNKATIRKMKI